MPAEAAGNESEPPEPTEEVTGVVVKPIRFFGTVTVVVIVWLYLMWKAMESDELQLHVLHFMVRTLQTFARVIGAWALTAETNYNKVVDSLH